MLVVLGGPIGVYEADSYPFLVDETDLIGRRIGLLRPTLGICLGAQLIAKSLGAKVAPGPAKEIGWARVELTDAGQTSPLRHLENVHVLHWHGDNFDSPPAARTSLSRRIARSRLSGGDQTCSGSNSTSRPTRDASRLG